MGGSMKPDAADLETPDIPADVAAIASRAREPEVVGAVLVPGPLLSPYAPEEAMRRLRSLATKGKLPDFETPEDSSAGALHDPSFRVLVFGTPYDRLLIGRIAPDGSGGSRVEFASRLRPKLPVVFVVVVLLSLWPGVWLTHSMLVTYFSWYRIQTWWWYIPLTLLVIPALWKQFRKSEGLAAQETDRLVRTIAQAIDGRGAA